MARLAFQSDMPNGLYSGGAEEPALPRLALGAHATGWMLTATEVRDLCSR